MQQAEAVGVSAELSQSYGNPGHVICDWSWTWNADAIVLGRQGKSHVPGWMMGSVSAYVTQHSACSVFMVAALLKPEVSPLRDRDRLVEV